MLYLNKYLHLFHMVELSYLIRVSEGYHSDGTQIKRSMTYTPEKGITARQAEKEAQRQAVLFEENCANGLYLDQSITLEKFRETFYPLFNPPSPTLSMTSPRHRAENIFCIRHI